MAGRNQHLEHLSSIPLFSSLSRKELGSVAKATSELQVAPGKVLVDQGDAGKEMFVLVAGAATVRRNGRKIATLGPGETVGELSLLDHGPRTATVTADTELTVLVLTARELASVLDAVPSVARKLLAALAGRVRDLDRAVYG